MFQLTSKFKTDKLSMVNSVCTPVFTIAIAALLFCSSELMAQPQYEIVSLGQIGEANSGGQAMSSNGQFATGFSDSDPFIWESGVGVTGLESHVSRPFSMPQDVNDSGTIVGIGATTFFGSGALPVRWEDGEEFLIALPAGETLGRAYGINNDGLIVGSVDGGSAEQAAIFSAEGPGTILTQTLAGGTLLTAYAVNDSGRIVGQADSTMSAAVTKGFYLDMGDAEATDIGALIALGHNSAIPFDVSNSGFITGSSSLNSGVDSRAFLWDETNGMIEIPLTKDTSTAIGRGVNDDGWVVGIGGGLFAVPFLYDGRATYRLQDIIVEGGLGWDIATGTSNGAFSISDNGTITGRGLLNGNLTAFVMVRIGVLLGDVNCDGVVDLLDVAPFVDAILTGIFIDKADINMDGDVDLLDVGPFVTLLSGN